MSLVMNHRVSLIGAPSDIGAGTRGASMGPEALRVADIRSILESQGVNVCDRGDLRGPANPVLGPVEGYRHLAEVTEWNRTVHDAVYRELVDSRMPILLGGDHSLSIGSISATARYCRERGRKLRVLWLDAHADFNTNVLTPSGNIHGMPVACLCGYGPKDLIEMSGRVPAIQAANIRQIGIRSVDQGEKRFVHEVGLEVFDMRFIDETGMRQTLANALESLDRDTHLHVSFDVDFLDPEIAPGVGVHGDDRRHGLAGIARHYGVESLARRAQSNGDGCGRSGRLAVRQEHADAAGTFAGAVLVARGVKSPSARDDAPERPTPAANRRGESGRSAL